MTPEEVDRILGRLPNAERYGIRADTPLRNVYPVGEQPTGRVAPNIPENMRRLGVTPGSPLSQFGPVGEQPTGRVAPNIPKNMLALGVTPDARLAQFGAVGESSAAARGIGSFLSPVARLAPVARFVSNPVLGFLAALLTPSDLGDGTIPQAPMLPEEPEGFPEASAVQSGFGYEGFDSASVSEDPEVNILSIDLLSPDMPDDLPSRGLDPSSSLRPEARPLPREQMPPRPRPQTYEVQSGDYLGRIAQRSGMSLARLLELNPQIENPDLIYPGQMINLG